MGHISDPPSTEAFVRAVVNRESPSRHEDGLVKKMLGGSQPATALKPKRVSGGQHDRGSAEKQAAGSPPVGLLPPGVQATQFTPEVRFTHFGWLKHQASVLAVQAVQYIAVHGVQYQYIAVHYTGNTIHIGTWYKQYNLYRCSYREYST